MLRLLSLKARLIIVAAVAVLLVLVMLIVAIGLIFASQSAAQAAGGSAAACAPNVDQVDTLAGKVSLYDQTQLQNAAAIMTAAVQDGLGVDAQELGVQAAIQESGLRVLDHGDQAGPDSRGLFQQRDNWGPLSVRMDPAGSATLFFDALKKIPGWEQMAPEDAIHAVQGNQRASDYAPRRSDAVEIVTAWAQASCTASVPADEGAAAQLLVTDQAAGKIRYENPQMWQQIIDYTTGDPKPNCRVDVRVMQVMLIAVQWYGSAGISDLGRQCVDNCSYGAGYNSLHCKSPDLAVDFTSLGGHALNGSDPMSVDFVRRLATVLPAGAGIGQADCRARALVPVATPGIRQFADTCSHLHVEMGIGTAALAITPPSGN